jgi:pimeloyl-ACP methyl ester carboxylesterase
MKTTTSLAHSRTRIGALSFFVSIATLSVLPALDLGGAAVSTERTRHLKVSSGTLAYDDSGGTGSVVICVPGMGDLRAQYRFLEPRLAAAGYRVITMDVRGQGESSTDWPEWDAPAVGRDVLDLMNALGIQKAHLVGNSFAAGSVYWAAVQEPERVASLIFLGPAMRDGKPNPVMNLAVRVGLSGFWGPGFWLGYWDGLFPVKKPADFAEYRAALLRNLQEPGRIAALKKLALASKAPIESILGQAKAPVLLIMGTRDKDFPDPAAEARLIGGKTRARVEMVESGHYPHIEQPDQTAALITAFLGGR